MKMNPAMLLFIILLFATVSSFFAMSKSFQQERQMSGFGIEGFKSSIFPKTLGDYPSSEEAGILTGNDIYPPTGMKVIGDEQEQKMWQTYPIFEVGSYEQITNNIRYPDNPDDGRCTAAEFCNIFYKDAPKGSQPSNVTTILPPVPSENGKTDARVNYYWTPENLLQFNSGGKLFVAP